MPPLARLSAIAILAFSFAGLPVASAQEPSTSPDDHQREELGVNPYTAPEVDEVFQQLDDVKPLPFDKLKRDFPQATRAGREQMGLIFGGLVADGFLIVACEKKNLVEDLGRVLLRQAKSLGVGERVIRHSASLTELGKRGDWPTMRKELTDTQADVERAMTELKDQKMAHLVSLGGWLRGLEISAGAVDADYSPERARGLWQRDLINYYAEEMKTLPPALAHDPLFEKVRGGVEAIRVILDKAPPDSMSHEEVTALHEQARQVNLAISQAAS
ncbi:MAG: hypothetical protein M3Z64_05370 [Verrucomicrobiota bacterium]|nr:hypothetical protein [Verrucomicrobiota bacterium]